MGKWELTNTLTCFKVGRRKRFEKLQDVYSKHVITNNVSMRKVFIGF